MLKLATEMIYRLADYAEAKNLTYPIDRPYVVNRLLEIMRMNAPEEIDYVSEAIPETATAYLEKLADAAAALGIIEGSAENRDLFTAKVMGALTPSPAEIREKFFKLYAVSPEAATDWFYHLCRDNDYIKVDRIAKNVRYFADSPCGRLEVTINLSKPEKDPRDIAAQRAMPQTGYPKCMLCVENPGYAGRIGFPARQNHRMIPVTLNDAQWYLQYSPYSYYPEHCIVLNEKHTPMHIGRQTFTRLLDFVTQFPHYFLGSNADLPIVGGSILTHDHFQGGRHEFPMDKAPDEVVLQAPKASVHAAIIDWPMSCLRLESSDRAALETLANELLEAWRKYSDADAGILAETYAPHNTVTPIARKTADGYRLDLVLRNNRTDDENPLGIYHPHADLHHIKKENIGLIEVMGLFILPGRLLTELGELAKYLTGEIALDTVPDEDSPLAKHYGWVCDIAKKTGTGLTAEQAEAAIHAALGVKCARVLADAGVYKQTAEGRAAFLRFLATLGYKAAR